MSGPAPLSLRERLGRCAAEARRELGLTQAEFAEQVGVTPNYIARVEGGHENLTLDSVEKLAAALSVDAQRLFRVPRGPAPKPGRPRHTRAPSKRS